MNKFQIFNYHLPDMKQQTGYDHKEIVNRNIFEVSQELFEKGINVMLYNSTEIPILFVDNGKFRQR